MSASPEILAVYQSLLDRGELDLLAGAGALGRLGGHRHQAHWQAAAIEEPALEDLVRLIMGQANTFLRRAPLAGIGAARRAPEMAAAEVYRIEKTARPR